MNFNLYNVPRHEHSCVSLSLTSQNLGKKTCSILRTRNRVSKMTECKLWKLNKCQILSNTDYIELTVSKYCHNNVSWICLLPLRESSGKHLWNIILCYSESPPQNDSQQCCEVTDCMIVWTDRKKSLCTARRARNTTGDNYRHKACSGGCLLRASTRKIFILYLYSCISFLFSQISCFFLQWESNIPTSLKY